MTQHSEKGAQKAYGRTATAEYAWTPPANPVKRAGLKFVGACKKRLRLEIPYPQSADRKPSMATARPKDMIE